MRGLAVINKAPISLLPKREWAVDIKDFRPVSLVHSAIKIFDKSLALRLAEDLPRLVGQHRRAFVHGRSLHDNFKFVQCTARRLHALRQPSIMLKLDITKAFDTVKWPFLLEVLGRFGFGSRWRAWMCGLLSTSSTRVMINSAPGKPIMPCKGLPQGAPLSPMMSILYMEPVRWLFQYCLEQGTLTPLTRTGLQQRVSLFADDIMVFFKPTELETRTCGAILDLFGHASGLIVNMSKSAAIPIRCSQDEMSLGLGCSSASFSYTYLGCRSLYASSPQRNFKA